MMRLTESHEILAYQSKKISRKQMRLGRVLVHWAFRFLSLARPARRACHSRSL